MMPRHPSRIVCLTEETTETLYRLGAGDLVVGVSAYTVRPPEARRKPRVSAFTTARVEKIDALAPDLIFAFSDLQADMVAALVRRGHTVMTFNQRSVDDILRMITTVGAIVGKADRAHHLCGNLEQGLAAIRLGASRLPRRPRVFFEEWPDPLISGIRWVDELVEIAGGDPIFPALRSAGLATDRIVTADAVRAAAPDVIVGSWCGRRMNKKTVAERPGWDEIPAIRHGNIHDIRSSFILQPGPIALTEGVRQLHAILRRAVGLPLEPMLAPEERWDAAGFTPSRASVGEAGHP
jgi:iron complex transport system substrate-binding protein